MHRRLLRASYIFTRNIRFLVNRRATAFGSTRQDYKIDNSIVLNGRTLLVNLKKSGKKALGGLGWSSRTVIVMIKN